MGVLAVRPMEEAMPVREGPERGRVVFAGERAGAVLLARMSRMPSWGPGGG